MGQYRAGWFLRAAGWTSCLLITALDIYGLPDSLARAWQVIVGG
jgi:manganese transport protein